MIELTIDNLVFGGRGVGRVDGKAHFVPYTIPGERVRCQVVRDRKNYCETELVEILDPSPRRVEPACPLFGECGGCQWQHLPYEAQLAAKESIFQESMSRVLPLAEQKFKPIVASPETWNYRCRAQLKCRMTGNGFISGFFRAGTHHIVDLETCPLLAPELNRILPGLKQHLAGFSLIHRLPQFDLTVDDYGRISVVLHYLEHKLHPLRNYLASIDFDPAVTFYVKTGRSSEIRAIGEQSIQLIKPLADRDLELQFPPGGFVQINLDQNRRLIGDVVAQVGRDRRVIDLFCGIGNFSLPLALTAESVVGIEGYGPSVDSALVNARRNHIDNVSFMSVAAETGVAGLLSDDMVDVVVLDPPRSGAYAVVEQLSSHKPQRIVYVSCDPMTLARDLKPLITAGYRPVSIQAYDMFPQTYHIEGMVVLEL